MFLPHRIAFVIALLAAVAALVLPGAAVSRPGANDLVGTVGPGFTISVKTPDGTPVTHLDPGTYTIQVHDESDEHNFHLFGPGVDQATGVDTEGDVTWTVTFTDGKYNFQCDAHPTQMKGSFTVGSVTSPPPPPPPTSKAKKLVGSVGSASISLGTTAGKRVSAVKAGTYRITVRDRSSRQNFHLLGPGLSKQITGVAFVGTKAATVKLKKGAAYRYRSDRSPRIKGSFRAT
jgi:plastocyanin